MKKLILCTTKDQLVDHYLIRKTVFIDEQKISYEDEYDFTEKEALPFLLFHQGIAVGASRIRFENDYAKLERICILKPYRGKGLGRILLDEMIGSMIKVIEGLNVSRQKILENIQENLE
jgi:predicted GNAT family N-acyltransferase